MTDRHDIQRARRYIVEYGITREQFRANFTPQFVKNNEREFDNDFSRTLALNKPPVVVMGVPQVQKPQRIKRIVIRHRYWRYNLNTHRIEGRWHGTRRRAR